MQYYATATRYCHNKVCHNKEAKKKQENKYVLRFPFSIFFLLPILFIPDAFHFVLYLYSMLSNFFVVCVSVSNGSLVVLFRAIFNILFPTLKSKSSYSNPNICATTLERRINDTIISHYNRLFLRERLRNLKEMMTVSVSVLDVTLVFVGCFLAMENPVE